MDENSITGDFVQIPPGEYKAVFFDFETRYFLGKRPKLYLWFTLTTPGFMDIKLPRYFNALKLSDKPMRGGRCTVGKMSNFAREYARLFGVLPDMESNWSERFTCCEFIVQIKTCDRGFDEKDIPECAQYSHIVEILGVDNAKSGSDDVFPLPNPFPAPSPAPTPT